MNDKRLVLNTISGNCYHLKMRFMTSFLVAMILLVLSRVGVGVYAEIGKCVMMAPLFLNKEHQREPGMELPPCCKSWDCRSRGIENMVPTAHIDLVTTTPLLQMGSKSNLTGVESRGEKELESSWVGT